MVHHQVIHNFHSRSHIYQLCNMALHQWFPILLGMRPIYSHRLLVVSYCIGYQDHIDDRMVQIQDHLNIPCFQNYQYIWFDMVDMELHQLYYLFFILITLY